MTPEQVKIFRAMSAARKLDLAGQFHCAARRLKAQGLRAQHPEWSDTRILQRVREIFLYAAN
ncbi:MAG: hypothetical protein HQ559_18395 [Lentisphaerae bacterium]|nr:hypothetical protein [Lentisphaerota bacterium]